MMKSGGIFFLILPLLFSASLACSLSGMYKQAQSIHNTAQSVRTQVGGIVTAGSSLITTAQALETQHSDMLQTAKAISTQVSPLISTIQAVASHHPGLVQTAQALIKQELPSGEPPSDIPIYDLQSADAFFGSSQYIFYIVSAEYDQVLEFYTTQMPVYGWEYQESDSHEFANASRLVFTKANRVTTLEMSINPLNHTTVIVISINTE
jgi:hypothetical protein